MKKVILVVLLVLIVLVGTALAVGLRAPAAADTAPPLPIGAARQASPAGDLPISVQVIEVCRFAFPNAIVGANALTGTFEMSAVAYRVIFPDGSSGLIDTGVPEEVCVELPGGHFFPEGKARIDALLPTARFVVLTHEHIDHAGPLAQTTLPVPFAVVTREQLESPQGGEVGFNLPPGQAFTPFVYEGVHAVAPGVALIKAPGHTPGSQMVLVSQKDGAELLFVGDVAWSAQNLLKLRSRPPLTVALLHEDAEAVRSQLRSIHQATMTEKVVAVAGHDTAQLRALMMRNLLGGNVAPPLDR